MASRSALRLLLREHGIPGGIETVNIQLVKEFTELVDRVVWVMPRSRFDYFQQFLPPSDRLIYEAESWPDRARLLHSFEKTVHFCLRQKNLPVRFVFENLRRTLSNVRLRRIIRDFNITHCFCSWVHVNVPRLSVPIGIIVLDVMWKYFPDSFGDFSADKVERRFCNWLRKAQVLFPVSEVTAADIKRFYPWYAGAIRVVPHGTLSSRHDGMPSTPVADTPHNRPVFYYPARAGTNKDHLTLFAACASLFAKGYDFEVVLTGDRTEHFNDTQPCNGAASIELCRAFLQREQALFRGRLKVRGYCERAEVEALYKRCTAVVLPSLREGFGLPLIEALENGTEIICSDIPAHREQLARYDCFDEVTLFPAGDVQALAVEMEKLLIASRGPHWRRRSESNTLAQWTWKDAATAYVEALSALTST